MRNLMLIIFSLLSPIILSGGTDFTKDEILKKIQELYPVKMRLISLKYEEENDQWVFYYEGNENCIDCDLYIIIKDDKENPELIVIPHG